MTTKTITHDIPGGTLKIVVGTATVLEGMKRSMLQSQALTILQEQDGQRQVPEDPDDLSLYLLQRYTWPNCMAPVRKSSKKLNHAELTFEQFCQLPEAFVAQWEKAALELNPHWQLQAESKEEEEAEKKDGDASSGE